MIKRLFSVAALAATLLGATPAPAPLPPPSFPAKPLHAQYTVEVNDKGQVVRVVHGTFSGERSFDTMTLGNAMQMWIRRPDGSAQTGLYRVAYDYDPKTHKVSRTPVLLSTGGNWAKTPGAATLIIDEAKRQTIEAYKRLEAEQKKQQAEREKHLPDINAAVRRAMAKPTPSPKP